LSQLENNWYQVEEEGGEIKIESWVLLEILERLIRYLGVSDLGFLISGLQIWAFRFGAFCIKKINVIYGFCRLCLLQPHPHQGVWVGVWVGMWVGCIMSHLKLCYIANATELHGLEHYGKMLVLAEDFEIVPILRYEFVLIMAVYFVLLNF
jgi:hypothetical protein